MTAVRCLGKPHARGLAALRAAGGRMIDIADLDLVTDQRLRAAPRPETDLAVDGVLGIGGRPGLPDDVARLARDLAGFVVPTIAVDLPSGGRRRHRGRAGDGILGHHDGHLRGDASPAT